MQDEQTSIALVVGYMLKVIKSGRDIQDFRQEFNAIKHGDYDYFIGLIKEPQADSIIQWKDGEMKTEGFAQSKGDSDIAMLYVIEPSIVKFGNDCFSAYGPVTDPDLSDLVFCQCAAFEISLRVQLNKEAKNRGLRYPGLTLQDTITELGVLNNIHAEDVALLQRGRQFVNTVKKHKAKFQDWKEGAMAFAKAWMVRNKYHLRIY